MELFDLFDKNRIPTGEIMEKWTPVPKDRYRQVIRIVIFNSKGETLIQQRTADKRSYPNAWDFSVSGSVIKGETSYQGAEREAFEELGLKVDLSNHRPSFTINFEKGFDDYYILNLDVDLDSLKLQKEEVAAVKWATKEEILKMIDDKEFINYRKPIVELLFDMQNSHYGVHTIK
jgi:isopentenyldiphosphate isomerase